MAKRRKETGEQSRGNRKELKYVPVFSGFFLKHISLHLNFTKTCNENINIPDFTDEGIEVTE